MAQSKPRKTGKAAAARAEKKFKPKSLIWHDLELTLPDEIAEEIFMDLPLIRASTEPGASFEMLLTLIGEEQYRQVRYILKTDETVTISDVSELIGRVFEQYGTTEGESEASQDS